MLQKHLTIANKLGLHARAAAKLAKTAARFACVIQVSKEKSQVDCKSVMSLMLLAAGKGTVLEFSCDGEDEELALEAIESLITNLFDEGE
ncbi:HPr family phosphocarrier protein [Aurantivibrio infirmus]